MLAQPLRILALNWRCVRHPQFGGAELNLFEQARRWARDGHQVTVFCADPGRAHAPSRDETIDGIEVRRRGGRFTVYLWAAWFLFRHPRAFDCVLDIANGIPFFAPLFSRTPATLLVHHVHDRQWFSEFPYAFAAIGCFLERRIVPLVYRNQPVIAVSSTTKEALLEQGFEPSQIRVIHNGVAAPALMSAARPTGERVAYVGRLKRYKRLDRLVFAIAHLRHEFPRIHLDIAGSGDTGPQLAALIDELGLRDHVTLHGFVDDQRKVEILRQATVFATPSMHEGWGISVLEANAFGCPAVTYDVPGLRVAVRHGETGLLAADDDDFARALAFFLRDHAAREQYSTAARAWAARFSWDSCARDTLDVLQTVVLDEPAYSAARVR